MELQTYWGEKGKYQAEYNRLSDLIPDRGQCETVAGELLRAAGRLTYDFYNNGMGNNTSGAVNLLKERNVITDDVYTTIYEYSRGRVYNGRYGVDSLHEAIVKCMDQTIEFILEHDHLETMENTVDMFDYEDEEQRFCEVCDCDIDYGWICEDCEEYQEEY